MTTNDGRYTFATYQEWCSATGVQPSEDGRRAWDAAWIQSRRALEEPQGRFAVSREDARWNGECVVHSINGTTCGTACLCDGARMKSDAHAHYKAGLAARKNTPQ